MSVWIRRFAVSSVCLLLAAGCGAGSPITTGPATISPTLATSPSSTPVATSTPATSSPTATASAAATQTARATSSAAPSKWDDLQFTELTPTAAIPVSGSGVIATATDGKTIWAVSSGALLKVDVKTNHVESIDAPVLPDDTTLVLADDGMWAARWAAGKLYRLDPQTGEVQVEAKVPSAVNIQFLGDDMWIGEESKHSMFKVDRLTGEIDPTTQLDASAYAAAGMGKFWFVDGRMVKSIDPATKEVTPVFDLSGVASCASGVGGKFPEAVWTGCLERTVAERSLARINLATKTVTALVNVPPAHGGAIVTIGDHEWFVGNFEDADGKPFAGLLRIDPQTSQPARFLSVAGADPDGTFFAGHTFWITDEAGHRLLKLNLADLNS